MVALVFLPILAHAQQSKPRARDLKIPFDGTPGKFNAITDVPGIEVGHKTIIKGSGKLEVGKGPARTGVTAIFPLGKNSMDRVFASWFTLNGNGEMTGTTWIDESGCLGSPILITNTHSVGTVRDAVIQWYVNKNVSDGGYSGDFSLPVVAETWDGFLNDINGFHVQAQQVEAALESATGGVVTEGNIGGGTGMICYEYKCGIGTASRIVNTLGGNYTVGVLVQANYGMRDNLSISGVPVGRHMREHRVYSETDPQASESGSIIIVVATDAPVLPHQLKRMAKRASLGLGRMGSIAGNGSGDIFISFGTGNPAGQTGLQQVKMLGNEHMDPLFGAVVQASEEAIVNAMIAAKDMVGEGGHYAKAIPHDQLKYWLEHYLRLAK